jgi:hypothetical protein
MNPSFRINHFTTLINHYAFYKENDEYIGTVRDENHGHGVRWLTHPFGTYVCFRRIPPATTFNHLVRVYDYLDLHRSDTNLEKDIFENEPFFVYHRSIPNDLHQLVVNEISCNDRLLEWLP